MKRLISLILTIAMLAGMCITAGAALPAVKEYVIDENTAISDSSSGNPYSYVKGKVFAGFRSGDGIPGKSGDAVYEMTYAHDSTGGTLLYKPADHTYADGDMVHLSTELMIPNGTSFASENMKKAPGLALQVADSAGNVYGLGVKNNGNKDSNNYVDARHMLVGFNPYNQRFILFGNSVYTDTTWEYDRWYRIDVVLVMGSSPKAAVYVNGNPLTVNPQHGLTGVSGHHYDESDATFDGSKTSSDYVDVGRRTGTLKQGNLVYEKADMYKVINFYPIYTYSSYATPNKTIYADNISYKALSANETPDIPAPLSIAGVEDGATLEHDELKALSINVPLWQRETTAKVAISVDGAEAVVDNTAPFTFDLRNIDRGVRNIDITTYDSSDNVLSTAHQTIVVAGNEKITRVEEEFESNILSGAFAGASTGSNDFDDTMKITNESIVDSAGVSYGKSVKIYSNNKIIRYGWGPAVTSGNYDTAAWPGYTDGLVNVSYDMYLDNKNASDIKFYHQHDSGYYFLTWDSTNQKFVTNKNWTGTTAAVTFDAEVKKWQKWDWTFDYDKGTVSLKIDGDTKLDKVAMHETAKAFGFHWWRIQFNSGSNGENFIGFDNFKVTWENTLAAVERDMYYANENKDYSAYGTQYWLNMGWFNTLQTWVPTAATNSSVKSGVVYGTDGNPLNADFKESIIGEFSNLDSYAAESRINIPVSVGLKKGQYAPNTGTVEIEYDYYFDSAATQVRMSWNNNRLWASVADTRNVKLDPGGSKTVENVLTPGQWQHHKLVIYPQLDSSKTTAMLQFYVDGELKAHYKVDYQIPGNSSNANYIHWDMKGVADTADSTKYAATKFAVDNIRVSYKPITPVITSVTFDDGEEKNGKVLASADSLTVNVAGRELTLEDMVSVKEVGSDAALGTVAVNGNTVTVSDLNLEAGKKYVVELAAGVGYDLQGCTTKQSSTYVFEAVEEFDPSPVITDGVDDAVTATDMRFTINRNSVSMSPVATYSGGRIPMDYHLRADVKVSNNSAEKKTLRALIATYEDGELTGIALGSEYTLNPHAKDWVITTGSIIRDVDTTPDIKVILVNDMNDIIPVSSSFDMEQ